MFAKHNINKPTDGNPSYTLTFIFHITILFISAQVNLNMLNLNTQSLKAVHV